MGLIHHNPSKSKLYWFRVFGNEWNRNPDLKELSCWLGSSPRSRFYSPALVRQLYLQTCCEVFRPRTCSRIWVPRRCASSFSVSLCNEYHQVSQRAKDLRTDRGLMDFVGTDPLMLWTISPREPSCTRIEGVLLIGTFLSSGRETGHSLARRWISPCLAKWQTLENWSGWWMLMEGSDISWLSSYVASSLMNSHQLS